MYHAMQSFYKRGGGGEGREAGGGEGEEGEEMHIGTAHV